MDPFEHAQLDAYFGRIASRFAPAERRPAAFLFHEPDAACVLVRRDPRSAALWPA